MPDYQKGKIYKLWSPQGKEDEIYIGSTCDELYKRKSAHKVNSNNCSSKKLFENYTDVRIELIEEYPCNNKEELTKKEGEYIRNNKCLNKCLVGRTEQEYYQDNKEKYKKYSKEYYNNNKVNIIEMKKKKVTCECGCIITYNDLPRHKKTNKHLNLMNNKNI